MSTPPSSDLILLAHNPIDADALIRHVRTGADGAIVTFDGCVRNQSHGRRTLYLDYEAYESMALTRPPRNRRDQRVHRGQRPASGSGVRCLPFCHRHSQTLGSDLEEGIFRRRRRLGRR